MNLNMVVDTASYSPEPSLVDLIRDVQVYQVKHSLAGRECSAVRLAVWLS